MPDYVFLDNQRFTQIILNLISNAVKFTPKGYVRVIVAFSPDKREKLNDKSIIKRNSAPDNINQYRNELLQMTSHSSDNSS